MRMSRIFQKGVSMQALGRLRRRQSAKTDARDEVKRLADASVREAFYVYQDNMSSLSVASDNAADQMAAMKGAYVDVGAMDVDVTTLGDATRVVQRVQRPTFYGYGPPTGVGFGTEWIKANLPPEPKPAAPLQPLSRGEPGERKIDLE